MPPLDSHRLSQLTAESTLADLPYWLLSVEEAEQSLRAAELFEQNPQLPGLLIFSGKNYKGVLSRESFYSKLGRRYGVEIFLNRPIQFMMEMEADPKTTLPYCTPIQKAAEICLSRQGQSIYEAIVVTFPNERPRLVGFRDLIVAQGRLLELASTTKDLFLATMSHELRTPLTSIIGYGEIVYDDLIEIGQKDCAALVGKMQLSARQLLELINSVLDLSKIETGSMDLCLETFKLSDLLQEVRSTLIPLAEKNHNALTFIIPPHLKTIHADRSKLRQNLLNLLSNSCKFTSAGQVTLTVKRESGSFLFTVSDSGIGMSPQQLTRIFKPFVQGDSSTTRKYGGTGLGLAITQRYCQLMGGSIRVESTMNVGTSFFMRIPQTVEPLHAPKAKTILLP